MENARAYGQTYQRRRLQHLLDELPNKVDGVDSNGVSLPGSAFHSFSAFEIKEKAETVVNTKPANEVDTSIDALAEQVAKLQAQANA